MLLLLRVLALRSKLGEPNDGIGGCVWALQIHPSASRQYLCPLACLPLRSLRSLLYSSSRIFPPFVRPHHSRISVVLPLIRIPPVSLTTSVYACVGVSYIIPWVFLNMHDHHEPSFISTVSCRRGMPWQRRIVQSVAVPRNPFTSSCMDRRATGTRRGCC